MPAADALSRRMLLCIYAAVLFAGFSYDIFRVVDREDYRTELTRHHFLGYDSYLVLDRLHLTEQRQVSLLSPLTEKFHSHFGLQGVVLGLIQRATGVSPVRLAYAAAAAGSLVTAILFAAFFVDVRRRFGPWAAGIGVLATACSPILALMVPSLYWCTYLMIAPFVATWLLHEWFESRTGGTWLRLGLVFALVLLKCLCGYEYVTTVILSQIPALWYFRCATQQSLRSFAIQSASVVAAGVAAFALAIVVHAVQLSQVAGIDGLKVIRERAVSRTLKEKGVEGPTIPIRKSFRGLPERIAYPASCFVEYFQLSAVETPGYLPQYRLPIPTRVFLGFAVLAAIAAFVARRYLPDAYRWLAGAACLAFLASISWNLLAVNHMCIHFHLNRIIFYIPFLPMCFALFGYGLDLLLQRVRLHGFAAACQLPALLALIAVGAVCESNQRAMEYAERSQARQIVEAHLERHEVSVMESAGRIDAVNDVRGFPSPEFDFGSEMNRSRLIQDRGERGKLIVITGWVAASGKAPPQILACRGDQILPAELRLVPRPDVAKAVGPGQCATGFALIIRSREQDSQMDLRVFAVMDGQVHELARPHGLDVARQ